jgi:ribonuclease HI
MNIFTDGSYKNKKGGIGVFFGINDQRNISEPLTCAKVTNQVAELTAVSRALDVLIEHKCTGIIYIYTDSKYVIGIFTDWIKEWIKNDWKRGVKGTQDVLNKELILSIYQKLKNFTIIFKHVRAHQVEPSKDYVNYEKWYGNNQADLIASSSY